MIVLNRRTTSDPLTGCLQVACATSIIFRRFSFEIPASMGNCGVVAALALLRFAIRLSVNLALKELLGEVPSESRPNEFSGAASRVESELSWPTPRRGKEGGEVGDGGVVVAVIIELSSLYESVGKWLR